MPGPPAARTLAGLLLAMLLFAAPAAADSRLDGIFVTTQDGGELESLTATCNPNGTSTISYVATGTIPSGERFAGPWRHTGTITLGPQTDVSGSHPQGPITGWSGTFTLGEGTATAESTSVQARPEWLDEESGNVGTCEPEIDDPHVSIHADALAFTAQVQDNGSTVTDEGMLTNTEVGDTDNEFPGRWFQAQYLSEPECDDGADNDADDQTDFPADAECDSRADRDEIDDADPTVTITTPAEGALYDLGAEVAADYACSDAGGSGLASCVGDVADGAPIDTATPGVHRFTVVAEDGEGNRTAVTHRYAVRGTGDEGLLAFRRDRDVWRAGTFGAGPAQLTDTGEEDFNWIDGHPDFSPDGEEIAFTSDRDDGLNSIWVVDRDGGIPVEVGGQGAGDGERPSWSTGDRIAFQTARHGRIGDTFFTNWEIYAVDRDGTDLARLTTNEVADEMPDWSPDGERIVYVATPPGGDSDLWVMDADGSDPVRLTDDAAADADPAWSPDGTKIAWTRRDELGVASVWVMDADGSDAVEVVDGARDPAWSPDAAQLAFAAPTPGGGGEGECGPFGCERRTATPRGTATSGPVQIFVAGADGSDRYQVTDGEEAFEPAWAPDGGTPPPGPVGLSVADVAVTERDEAPVDAAFAVTLDEPAPSGGLTLTWTAAAGSAGLQDAALGSGTATVAAGEDQVAIPVAVKGDRLDEAAEHFDLTVAVTGRSVTGDPTGRATIHDDDAPPPVSVTDAYVLEGDTGQRAMTFAVRLARPSGKPVTVALATADLTATAGSDYQARTAALTIPPGQAETPVAVQVLGDAAREYDFERLALDITASSNPRESWRGTGTIVDDDPGPGVAPPAEPAPRAALPLPAVAVLRSSGAVSLAGRRALVDRRGRVTLRVACAGTATCRGRVALRRGRAVLGGTRVAVPAGRMRAVRVGLSRRGRRLVRARGRLAVDAVVVTGTARVRRAMELRVRR